MNYTVQSVDIKSRWIPKQLKNTIDTLIGVGRHYDPANVGIAKHLISIALTKNEFDFSIRLVGSTSVLVIDADICDVSDATHPKQVKVEIRPHYLRIDLYDLGSSILPVPRSPRPAFYRNVPKIILATSPKFGISHDKAYGTALNLQLVTDLLDPGGTSDEKKGSKKPRLNLGVDFRKSIDKIFNTVSADLQILQKSYEIKSIGWNFGFLYANSVGPLNFGENRQELFRIAGGIHGNTKSKLLSRYNFGGGFRFLESRYNVLPGNKIQNPEKGFEFYALGDGSIAHGFSRAGIWFDAGVPRDNTNLTSYQRLAGILGYAITLGKGHNNVDLETTVNLGYTFGSPPIYNQFFAGNRSANFLYSSLTSLANQQLPAGPIVRSLGENTGGINPVPSETSGGSSFWGINMSFSIPVSRWAKPLIPDIIIDEDLELTLPTAITSQGVTAKSFIAGDLVKNGLSDEEADAKAQAIVDKDINPMLRYLARRANVYSIKPVVYFDLAQMKRGKSGEEVWGAAGAGVQLNIVNAKFDIGYMQTLFPSAYNSTGNFLLRFTVQNIY